MIFFLLYFFVIALIYKNGCRVAKGKRVTLRLMKVGILKCEFLQSWFRFGTIRKYCKITKVSLLPSSALYYFIHFLKKKNRFSKRVNIFD